MDPAEIKHFIEAALLAAGRPLNVEQIQSLFDGRMTPERSEIRQAVTTLNEEYEGRGILISEVASGFRVQVRSGMADQLQKLWEERPPRYSRAMFETLALVAYRQPITRGEIEEIRGVSVSSNIVRTLLEREWVRIVGHRDVPGRPEMFGTTKSFLDYFGLKKLDDLPPLADLSDWESLRVQLNLPEVEEEAGEGGSEGTDLPVLYPEIPAEEADDSSDESEAVPEESSEVPEDDIPELTPIDSDSDEVADDLLVSKWPDPAEIGS
jgi:segregation and condensation protein B